MLVGVVGLGSMGTRRMRDLLHLGCAVVGFDVRESRRRRASERFGVEVVQDQTDLFALGLDALVISTPPDRHLEYYAASFAAGVSFFSEANILTPRPDWFTKEARASGVNGYPSATWRFHPLIVRLRDEIARREPSSLNSVHHHYAGHLPRWHPWEAYDEFYAGARRATCAARELVPFELEWLCWIFGPVRAVCAWRGRRADWRSDIDDTYMLLLEFQSGLPGSLIVELHQVVPGRAARIACRRQAFQLDLVAHELRRHDAETDAWERWPAAGAPFDFETVYRDEMEAFLRAIKGEAIYPKTWAEDRHLSDVLVAAEESDRRRSWVDVARVADTYAGRLDDAVGQTHA